MQRCALVGSSALLLIVRDYPILPLLLAEDDYDDEDDLLAAS